MGFHRLGSDVGLIGFIPYSAHFWHRKIEELYRQLHEIGFFSDGKGGGVYPACWDEDDEMLVRAPGLEPGTP